MRVVVLHYAMQLALSLVLLEPVLHGVFQSTGTARYDPGELLWLAQVHGYDEVGEKAPIDVHDVGIGHGAIEFAFPNPAQQLFGVRVFRDLPTQAGVFGLQCLQAFYVAAVRDHVQLDIGELVDGIRPFAAALANDLLCHGLVSGAETESFFARLGAGDAAGHHIAFAFGEIVQHAGNRVHDHEFGLDADRFRKRHRHIVFGTGGLVVVSDVVSGGGIACENDKSAAFLDRAQMRIVMAGTGPKHQCCNGCEKAPCGCAELHPFRSMIEAAIHDRWSIPA